MQSAPLPEDEPSRLKTLHEYKILDTTAEESFDNLVKLAAQICGTPIALVSLVDAHRQWFKARVGIEAPETPRDIAFCAHAIHGQDLFVVPDTTEDERFADNPLVTADPYIRFYAGMPLVATTGHAVGTLSVIDRVPKQLTTDQMNALRMLGQQAVSRLESRRRQIDLEHALAQREQSDRTNADIIRAIDRGLEGVAFLDQDGCYTYMNPAHAAIYEYKPEELIGRSWTTLYDPEWIARIESEYFPILLNTRHWTGLVQGRTQSGGRIFAELSLVLAEQPHDPARWLMCTCRDVTERVTSRQLLEAHRENLALAQALAHVGSWEWDIESGTEIWSDEQFRIFGYEPHSITPTIETFREAIHPDDRGRVLKAVEDALERNQPYEVSCRIVRPNGDTRTVLCHGTVTRNTGGHPSHMVGAVQDMTEQKAFEQILNDTIQRLDLATKSGGIGVWDYYIPENKLVWDKQMYELYGYSAENFPGAYEAWTDRLHPEDRPYAETLLQSAIEGRDQFDTEFRLILPDQRIRHIKATATVLKNDHGQAVRMIGTNHDITARKESQLALLKLQGFQQAILLNAPHAVIAASTTGIIQHFNPAAERLLGYSAEEMIGKLTPAVFHNAEEVAARAKIFGAELGIELESGFEVFVAKARRNLPNQHEWIYIRKDGTRVPVLLSVTAIRDHTGLITGFLGMATDISVQKKAERSRLTAEAALREKEELTRAMIENVIDYAIVRLDPKGRIESWNQGAERQKGYSADEIIGRHFSCFFTDEDLALHKPTAMLTNATAHRHAEDEGWRLRKGGSRFWANVVITALFDQDGQLNGFTKVVRDITERKQAEVALTKFKSTLDQTRDFVFMFDPETLRFTYCNRGACEHVGYSEAEILTMTPLDIKPLFTPEQFQTHVQPLRDGALPSVQFETLHRHKDGHDIPVEIALQLVRYEQGSPLFVAVVRDITARKHAEEQFREVVEAAPNGILVANQEGVITLVNAQLERYFGYDRQELIGQPVELLLPERFRAQHPAHRASFYHNPQARAMGAGRDLFGRRKDGSEFPLEIGLSPIHTAQGTQILASIVDISARKHAEEQFREVVEAAPNGILVANQEGVITLVNAQLERYFGYDRQELIGQPVELLLPERFRAQHPAHRASFYHNPQARAMGSGRDLFGCRKDGSEFPLEIGLSPIRTAHGTQILASIVDITSRKQGEIQLKETAQELASKNIRLLEANQAVLNATRAKSEFLATMSHEIRTPMNAIVGMAELLQETSLTPDQANYVGRFSRAAATLLDLINAILDLSKIEAGYMSLESVPFDLHSLVDTIADLMVGKALAKRLELLVLVHPDVPHGVVGDPTRLNQVLVNLVGNAVKFTESGHVMIKIEPAGEQAAAHALRFSVSDTGIGIPPDKVGTIFEPFTQVDSTTTRKYGGSGLGLNISKRIVELMGGRLECVSTLGAGSAFSFVVSLSEAPLLVAKQVGQYLDLHGRRFLIVDDNDTNRMIIREHLSRSGVHLVEAASADTALTALDEAQRLNERFDLAILDYHMPVVNGLDLAESIRRRPECATLPLVMHVSDLQRDDTRRARSLGIKNYLYKPLSRRRLMESLALALDQVLPEPIQPESESLPEPSVLLPYHILLVEDLEDNREVVNLFLKETPYRLDMAENGAVALKKFKEGSYDLVFMDMQMPVMDGLEATGAIRRWEQEQHRRPTPIIALTANAFKEEADRSLAAGCTAHVTKPIKKKALLATITQYANAAKDQAA